ncbi:MAG: hypothetical protein D8B47_00525 [Kingella sp. (in: b-proteobacteria)]|nr:MAG: hypothetical protein D8B47_00525 [Kingella sp. (in: b-proteobacteria)]
MKPYPYLFAVAALSATLTHAHLLPPAQAKLECTYQDLTRAGSPVEKAACIYRDGLPPRPAYEPDRTTDVLRETVYVHLDNGKSVTFQHEYKRNAEGGREVAADWMDGAAYRREMRTIDGQEWPCFRSDKAELCLRKMQPAGR